MMCVSLQLLIFWTLNGLHLTCAERATYSELVGARGWKSHGVSPRLGIRQEAIFVCLRAVVCVGQRSENRRTAAAGWGRNRRNPERTGREKCACGSHVTGPHRDPTG